VYTLTVEVDGIKFDAACDTGSPCNLIPVDLFREMKTPKLKSCESPYVNYNGDPIRILGEFVAQIKFKDTYANSILLVTQSKNMPLLGGSFLRAFHFELCQVNAIESGESTKTLVDQIQNKFSSVFSDEL